MSSTDKITLNRNEIERKTDRGGKFVNKGISLKQWTGNDDKKMYAAEIENNGNKLIGVLDSFFQRNGYGVNQYANGDKYFGFFLNDMKQKNGLYEFNPTVTGNERAREFYYGCWKNDKKDGNGVYLWLREPKNRTSFQRFDDANFSAFVGEYEEDVMKFGTYLNKEGNSYYVYHGGFNENGERDTDEGFLFSSDDEICYLGSFKNNNFNGYVTKFTDEGKLIANTWLNNDNIENNGPDEQKDQLCYLFRNQIMQKDYFGELFDIFKEALNFRDREIRNLDILNGDKYLDILDFTSAYNKISINKDILENVIDLRKNDE